jgi:uncharacterized membrane protein YfhO
MRTSTKLHTTAVYLIPLGVFALMAACFFHEAIFSGKVFSARDHYLFFMPRRFFALETLLNGSLPLWNPLNACGVPFLANVQSSIFYPLSALVYLLPFPAGYNAFVIVHYILASMCMYALMRHWNSSPFASTVAALVFAFGGYMQSINDNLAFLTSTAWLPLIMLCFSRALQERRSVYTILTMLLIGLQILAGDASFCVISTMLCTGLYALCVPRSIVRREAWSRAGALLAVWTGGLLLAAVVLLPFIEYVSQSHRAGGLEAAQALHWSLHPLELLQFVHPYLFGRLVPLTRWFGQHWLDTIYIGIFPLCFATVYLRRRRCEHKLFLSIVVLLGLFLALGKYNPLLSFIMHKAPALRLMQYPVKFLLLSAFGLAVMSGFGVDEFFLRVRTRANIRGILKPLLIPMCGLFTLLLAMAAGRELLLKLFNKVYPATDYYAPLRDASFFNLYQGVFFSALLLGGFAALTWCTIRFKKNPAIPGALIGIILCADLFFLGAPGDSWLDRQALLRPSPVTNALQEDDSFYRIYSLSRIASGLSYSHTPHLPFDRVYRILTQSLPPNLHLYHGFASVDEYTAMLNVRHYDVFGRALLHLADRSDNPAGNQYCRKVFSMLNVKYIISPRALPELQFELMRDGPVKIYRNQNVWPRAFMAGQVVVCFDDATVLKQIHTADFEPQTVFLPQAELDKLPVQMQTLISSEDSGRQKQAVTIERYEANRVKLRVNNENYGLMVLSDTWFPGWIARVNDKDSPVLRVNHTLRAVALKPGISQVEFLYRPRSFIIGLMLSLSVLLAMLAAICAERLHSARRYRIKSGAVGKQHNR